MCPVRTYKDLQFIVGQDIGHGLLRNRVMDYNCPQAKALNMEKNTKKDTLNHTSCPHRQHNRMLSTCDIYFAAQSTFYIFFPVLFKHVTTVSSVSYTNRADECKRAAEATPIVIHASLMDWIAIRH